MKASFLSALAVASAIGVAVTATDCDITAIRTILSTGDKTKTILAANEDECLEDSGYDIFSITTFPTLDQAEAAQGSNACSNLVNLVNGQVNIDTQCILQLNGTTITYGKLISSFINGKTGNESDSGSGSVELPSESASGSESESESDSTSASASTSASTSGSATTALSFVTYGVIAAIAAALR
ncbi:unnamed protein product [Phytophthora lilii]|uniref:Elicitin n=1 Tax=Phytophthora lilii TaxID=2077276 RepID=A0A9W6TBX6_9STRA|nr:unnamed protein product [Phytophthora lilii]